MLSQYMLFFLAFRARLPLLKVKQKKQKKQNIHTNEDYLSYQVGTLMLTCTRLVDSASTFNCSCDYYYYRKGVLRFGNLLTSCCIQDTCGVPVAEGSPRRNQRQGPGCVPVWHRRRGRGIHGCVDGCHHGQLEGRRQYDGDRDDGRPTAI